MSVLIKGIELSEKVQVLELHHDGKVFTRKGYLVGEAVELPDKHGRLIDEDDVIDAIHERLHELQTHKGFIKKRGDIDLLGILPYIAKIQTIIEAEGDE